MCELSSNNVQHSVQQLLTDKHSDSPDTPGSLLHAASAAGSSRELSSSMVGPRSREDGGVTDLKI